MAPGHQARAHYATENGTAVAGQDYKPVSGTHVDNKSWPNSWLCIDAELVAECGRSVRPNTAHVGPLFDQIVESLRLGTLRD